MMTQPTDISRYPSGLSKRRKQRRRSSLDHQYGLGDNAVTCSRRATTKPGSWSGQTVFFSFSCRKSHPATPLLPWRSAGTFPPVSARKLAAELWCLDRSCKTSKEADRQNIAASTVVPYGLVNRAVEWNVSPAHGDLFRVYGNEKLFKSYMNDAFEMTSLVSDLQMACTRVCKLETDHQKFRIKLLHLLMNLAEERSGWQRKEFLRIQGRVDTVKHDLCRERKSRRKLEILNSKLNIEVVETKQSLKCFVQSYGKEKKARELIEQVCDELAKENGNNKAKKHAIKKEFMKILREIEEEKEMLQMAETWREERVQMKLLEAKGILEDKFSQLCRVKSDLETLIKSRSEITDIVEVTQESELSISARNTNKVLAGNVFSHQPNSRRGTLFASNIVSQPEHAISACPNNPANMKSDDDGSESETVTQDEEHSSSTQDEICPSMGSMGVIRSLVSENVVEWKKTYEDKEQSNKLALEEQTSKLPSSISKLRRSGTIDRSCNSIAVDESNEKIRGTGLNLKKSVEVGINAAKKGRRCSPTPANPHVNRGIRGCIAWPKTSQKTGFRSNLLEAEIESQKVQLRQILKQKL